MEVRKLLGYFEWKITILRQKINFRGGRAPGAPPWIRPWVWFKSDNSDTLDYQHIDIIETLGSIACCHIWLTTIVSDWLLFNGNSAIFSMSWWKQVNFQWDDDEVRLVLDQHAELDFNSASSLKQQSVDRYFAPLGHIILIPSQPVFVLTP
jgi:hypothetical protein